MTRSDKSEEKHDWKCDRVAVKCYRLSPEFGTNQEHAKRRPSDELYFRSSASMNLSSFATLSGMGMSPASYLAYTWPAFAESFAEFRLRQPEPLSLTSKRVLVHMPDCIIVIQLRANQFSLSVAAPFARMKSAAFCAAAAAWTTSFLSSRSFESQD